MIITDSTGGNIRCNENGVLSAFENKTAAALRAQFIAQRARKRCAEAGKASVSMN